MSVPSSPVTVRSDSLVLPTYEPLPPDRNPMFLENRVYQGSSGRVYPLPFYNRISDKPVERAWRRLVIENDLVEVEILPELGGRIHAARDKVNGYDLFYRQQVIKPALVGLAGPWISGGVEFNWPQHHRPATFMPVDTEIEHHEDGSVTVWLGDHDPMARMKGMHGVCLRPGSRLIELKARVHNRTPLPQTFLWWANVATRVHEGYQSFFPPDVHFVADHARRAMSHFPLCQGRYYGVDYAARARDGIPDGEIPARYVPPHCRPAEAASALPGYAPNDLSWYANIPVPTSYMCIGSEQDFSGGYDHFRQAGLIQIADHHIAPGKKQWTWGNQEFGYAWDRNLTDGDGPYIELMLGVFTDNQPDFSFLQPGESRAWSIFWYPLREIGPARAANRDAALSLRREGDSLRVGLVSTRALPQARLTLHSGGTLLAEVCCTLQPGAPLLHTVSSASGLDPATVSAELLDSRGRRILYCDTTKPPPATMPAPATEPPEPAEVASVDELYTIGVHLEQYRHATRCPAGYWREALRRDPGDARCNTALGAWHLRRGEFPEAEARLRTALARQTSRNANPRDGETLYLLGLCLRWQGRDDEAFTHFAKATWNQAWRGCASHRLAEIACARHDWTEALTRLDDCLRLDSENLGARNLRALVLGRLSRHDEAAAQVKANLALDRLDWWARQLAGEALTCDTQTRLDLALTHADAGLHQEAATLLSDASPEPGSGTAPLVAYHLARQLRLCGRHEEARVAGRRGAEADPSYCFPARLEDLVALQDALTENPADAHAHLALGNLLYDRRRHREAITHWEQAAILAPALATAWRNLGIARFNIHQDTAAARAAYDRAVAADTADPRLLHERDQLWKRTGEAPQRRLAVFEASLHLVLQRDDATVEYCALLNQLGRHAEAWSLIDSRRFQPWEGGEGLALGQHTRTALALARGDLRAGRTSEALSRLQRALQPPHSLGEARHLLANASDLHLALGDALQASGRGDEAREAWTRAAEFRGDFQDMAVRSFSDMTHHSARALRRLGRDDEADQLLQQFLTHALELAQTPAKIDYFATSLPTMLLFNDDLQARQLRAARLMEAQARLGLGQTKESRALLLGILQADPGDPAASDLLSELPPAP